MVCVFCELLEKGNIMKVVETPNFVAFLDINPRAIGHTIVASKKHYSSFEELPQGILGELLYAVQTIIIKAKKVLKAKGASVTINSGEVAGQRISHFNLMVFPRYGDEERTGVPAGAIFSPIKMDENELKGVWEKMRILPKIEEIGKEEKPREGKNMKLKEKTEVKKHPKGKKKKRIKLRENGYGEFV